MPCRLNHPAISAGLRGPLAEPAAAERWQWASLPHRSSPPPLAIRRPTRLRAHWQDALLSGRWHDLERREWLL